MLADTDLIDAQYLIALGDAGGIVPLWQDCPREAFIGCHNMWRLRCWGFINLPVIVLSYPWLDRDHPDAQGEQLRRLVPILRAFVRQAQKYGPHATVGVLWDFISLPQKPYSDPSEAERFQRGLRSINSWYAHPCTTSLLVKGPLPSGGYTNLRTYDARGWCFFEERISGLVKEDYCLWDQSRYTGASTYLECIHQMAGGTRLPPMSPERFGRDLREGCASGALAFTSCADLETVIALYERGYVHTLDGYRALRDHGGVVVYYKHLGWGAADVSVLVEAVAYARQHCVFPSGGLILDLSGNDLCEDDFAALKQAAKGSSLTIMAHSSMGMAHKSFEQMSPLEFERHVEFEVALRNDDDQRA